MVCKDFKRHWPVPECSTGRWNMFFLGDHGVTMESRETKLISQRKFYHIWSQPKRTCSVCFLFVLVLRQDLCQDLCEIAGKWPEEDEDEDHEAASSGIFLRLEEALLKLPPGVQQQVVASFRPLKAEVSRRLAEWTNEFNDWLNEAGQMQSSKLQQTQQTQHLGELLQEVESSPQLLWYRQCPKARVKTKFLMAVASLVRALTQGSPLVKPWVEQHPALQSLAQKIMKRLFVLPGLGNILETWHDGRLACYNATLSLAAQRAADKMRDDLQVSLVSAVKRATANTGDEKLRGPKQALQLQMRDWPMSGCPLARALLEFLKSHAVDLGDLGRPSLREIPPHSLKPATLRNLLSRLDAFDLVGPGPISLVRLRFEAVAALAYKAVGTKPKARAAPPVTMSPPQASGPSGPVGTGTWDQHGLPGLYQCPLDVAAHSQRFAGWRWRLETELDPVLLEEGYFIQIVQPKSCTWSTTRDVGRLCWKSFAKVETRFLGPVLVERRSRPCSLSLQGHPGRGCPRCPAEPGGPVARRVPPARSSGSPRASQVQEAPGGFDVGVVQQFFRVQEKEKEVPAWEEAWRWLLRLQKYKSRSDDDESSDDESSNDGREYGDEQHDGSCGYHGYTHNHAEHVWLAQRY